MNTKSYIAAFALSLWLVLGALACGRSSEIPAEVEAGVPLIRERAKVLTELEPPAGAIAKLTSGGGHDGAQFFQIRVETQLPVNEVLSHYTSELQSRGWTAPSTLQEDTVGIQTLRFRNDEAADWHGVVVVAKSLEPTGHVWVTLHLTRVVLDDRKEALKGGFQD